MKIVASVFALTLLSEGVFGAEQASIDALATETLWRVFASLGLILVAIFALVWVLRRSGQLVRGKGGKMQVVDVLSLGQRERLVLVSVGDKQLVLGVSPGRVETVHCLDTPLIDDTADVRGGNFADALRRVSDSAEQRQGSRDE